MLSPSLPPLNPFLSSKFKNSFAFGAECLVTHYVAIWMMSYADQVIVSGQPPQDAIPSLLYNSKLSKYTSTIFLNRLPNDQLTIYRYLWEHNAQRPNTFSFPMSCPSCNSVYSWQNIPAFVTAAGTSFTMRCKTKIDGVKCEGICVIPARPESSCIKYPYTGTWRVQEVESM